MPMAPATHGAERQPGAPAVEYYASGAYLQIHPTVQDDEAPWKAGQVVALLAKHQIVPHRLLDVGCGPGGVLDILVSRAFPGAIGVGYDVAPDAIHRAERRRVGNEALTFHCGDVTAEELESQVYDVLLCLDVFEHVDDYIGFLRRLRGRASHYIFHIPLEVNVNYTLRRRLAWARRSNGHLHFFDRDAALGTLQDTGFELVDWSYTRVQEDLAGIHPEYGRAVRALNVLRRLIYPLFPEIAVRVFGGYSLLVLAR